MSRKRILQLVCVTASVATLLWLLQRIGWSTIGTALSQVGWLSATVLFLLALAEGVFDGIALRVVTGPSLSTWFTIAVNSASSLLNLVLPWESGEILKGGLMRQTLGTSEAVSSTVIWNYVFKISRPAFGLAAALMAVVLCPKTPAATLSLIVAGNVIAFAPYLLLRFVIRFGAAEKLVKLARHLPYVRRSPEHWVDVARTIDRQVLAFWHERPWAYVQCFLLQVLARSTGVLNLYVGFWAMGMPYGLAEATLLHATMNIAEYIISLLPARVGVGESTAFVVFRLYGFDSGMGLVLYTFLRVRNILVHGFITPFAFIGRKATSGNAVAPRRPGNE
jgi:hypothetical protein